MAEDLYPTERKQAYLVLAHRTDTVFRTLLQMLDHKKTDIFIHMDAKTKSYDPAETMKLVKHSRVIHAPRIKVSWGAYSQLEAMLTLLETASSHGHYEHYHLLSETCLPIKKQDDIIAFFEAHHGLEFVSFAPAIRRNDRWVRYYYPFQEIRSRSKSQIWRIISGITVVLQMILGVRRNKGINFERGTDWFSITDEFARYVLSKRGRTKSVFHHALHANEIFIHTLLINSPFLDNLYHKEFDDDHVKGAVRLIDWNRGSPYTFRMSDLQEIMTSPAMFARKFDEAVDIDIVRKIQELYS